MIADDEFLARISQGSSFRILKADPAAALDSFSMLPPPEKAAGQFDVYCQDQNLGLTIRNLRPKCGFSDDQVGLGRIIFLLHLSGKRRIELGAHSYELAEPTLAIFYHPPGLKKRSVWSDDADEISLTIGMWPHGLSSLCDFSAMDLPGISSISGDRSDVFWYARPLPYTLMSATENLFHHSVDRRVAKAFITAKSTEIACLSLDTLLTDGSFLVRRDVAVDRLERIRTLIEASLPNPPSLCDLAATFGMQPQDLSVEIREGLGVSLNQYITSRRMERARTLLESENMPLKQVAYKVGYCHASNFCTAFKRHFGRPPKNYMRLC
ncbi:helix-turn-helix transcriptional regulator [Sphingomonas flavalba]|uniref:helix-turn-helix transcriptional regulator n=1 Tax=Sphingomonas flavalba TaxID=2559804 RepID=UPI00109E0CEE|nr:AraC family transcriptional regulator [Sphingomonas flavalba]